MTSSLRDPSHLQAVLAAMKGCADVHAQAPLLPPGEAWEVLVARGLLPMSWAAPSEAPVGWGCRLCLRSKWGCPDGECLFCRGEGEVGRPDAPTLLAAAAAGPDVLATIADLAGSLSGKHRGLRPAVLAASERVMGDLLFSAADPLTALDPWEVYAAEWAREHVALDGFDEAAMSARYGAAGAGSYAALARLHAMGVHVLGRTRARSLLLGMADADSAPVTDDVRRSPGA